MPELPEVEIARRALHRWGTGRQVVVLSLEDPACVRPRLTTRPSEALPEAEAVLPRLPTDEDQRLLLDTVVQSGWRVGECLSRSGERHRLTLQLILALKQLGIVRLDEEGRYRSRFSPTQARPHHVRVEAAGDLTASDRFLVRSRSRELDHLSPDPELMAAIAATTGGTHALDRLDPDTLALADTPTQDVLSRRDITLWDHPAAIALLLLLLAAEWLLRRRHGLG